MSRERSFRSVVLTGLVGAVVTLVARWPLFSAAAPPQLGLPDEVSASLVGVPDSSRAVFERAFLEYMNSASDAGLIATAEQAGVDDYESGFEFGRNLLADGILLIPDDDLIELIELERRMAELMDVESCAALMSGRATPGLTYRFLARLPPSDIERFFALRTKVIHAVQGSSRFRPASEDEIVDAFLEIAEALPASEAIRLVNLIDSEQTDSVSQCEIGKLLEDGVVALGPERGARAFRAVMAQ